MTTNLVTLNAKTALKDAAKLFVRYSFRAIPIVDDEGVMIAAIPYRDVWICSRGLGPPLKDDKLAVSLTGTKPRISAGFTVITRNV